MKQGVVSHCTETKIGNQTMGASISLGICRPKPY